MGTKKQQNGGGGGGAKINVKVGPKLVLGGPYFLKNMERPVGPHLGESKSFMTGAAVCIPGSIPHV